MPLEGWGMAIDDSEPRIAVFLDYENLAIGAKDNLGAAFNFGPVADALAERGRVIHRKAYADWSYFDSDRRMLTRHQVQVIGVGVRQSTSKLLPPACDEFMFYDNLVSDDEPKKKSKSKADDDGPSAKTDIAIVTSTLAGLSSSSGTVRSSRLKRALLRKDPTFSEAELGFRNFGALLADLADRGLVELTGSGDPEVSLSGSSGEEVDELLTDLITEKGPIPLTGLKTALRKRKPDFNEKTLGYRNFNSFVTAAEARGVIKITGKSDGRMVAAPSKRRKR